MNYLAARAEMAVRSGAVQDDQDFVEMITEENIFDRIGSRAKKQVEDQKRMMRSAARKAKKK